MTKRNLAFSVILCAAMASGPEILAQPAQNINSQKHPHLAAAQSSIAHAYQQISESQAIFHDRLGSHGEKAKSLLDEAAREIKLAAEYANAHDYGHK